MVLLVLTPPATNVVKLLLYFWSSEVCCELIPNRKTLRILGQNFLPRHRPTIGVTVRHRGPFRLFVSNKLIVQ